MLRVVKPTEQVMRPRVDVQGRSVVALRSTVSDIAVPRDAGAGGPTISAKICTREGRLGVVGEGEGQDGGGLQEVDRGGGRGDRAPEQELGGARGAGDGERVGDRVGLVTARAAAATRGQGHPGSRRRHSRHHERCLGLAPRLGLRRSHRLAPRDLEGVPGGLGIAVGRDRDLGVAHQAPGRTARWRARSRRGRRRPGPSRGKPGRPRPSGWGRGTGDARPRSGPSRPRFHSPASTLP